jgi:murein DD-endopeptidase MepM/ murein hydrolase activator NlpD
MSRLLRRGGVLAAVAAVAMGLGPAGAPLLSPSDALAFKFGKFGKRSLKPGMRGKDVRVLQRSLTRLKLRTRVDGRYGKRTKRNVLALERRLGDRRVDGKINRMDARRIKGLINEQLARKRAAIGTAGYVFPVPDPHDFGGASARFGAPRSGHSHQGQDVFAPCGARMLAAQPGNVKVNSYQGAAGHYLVIDGLDGSDTAYMHMQKRSWAAVGTLLYAGQQIGKVGASGNASGCHLHFEHWTYPGWYSGGYPIDPLPELLQWDAYS